MFMHHFQTLANGLPVLRVPMSGVESVTVLVLVNTGSRYETSAQEGIAHFFEHMVFKGSQNYPTAAALAMTVDGVGADFNAFTGKEHTGYYVKAASRHLELALDVVSDMLLTPKLRQEDIDREKGVIIEEMHMYEDSPARHVGSLFDQMAFSNGLSHDIIGTVKTVSAFTTADFASFLREWYGLPNMLLVLAGDAAMVGSDRALELARVAFSKHDEATAGRVEQRVDVLANLQELEKKSVKKSVKKSEGDSTEAAGKTGVHSPFSDKHFHLETKKTEQAHFVVAWPGVSRHAENRYALSLLNIILGANMSSRLFTEVREKRGLAYYVNSTVDLYHDCGLFGAAVGADPKRVEEALEVTIQEFLKLTADGGPTHQASPITAGELSRTKEYVAGKMALSYEDPLAIAQYYGMKKLLNDEIETVDEALAKLQAVTLDEVQAVGQKLIKPEELRLAMIGPFKDEAKFRRYL